MSALDLIGRTPIVELRNLGGHTSFEKLPNCNPHTKQSLLARLYLAHGVHARLSAF